MAVFDAVQFLNGLFAGDRQDGITDPIEPATTRPVEPTRHVQSPDDLTGDWREAFEERAAIMEFDAHMTRQDAESMALADILKLMKDHNE